MKSYLYVVLAFLLAFTSSAPTMAALAKAVSTFSCADVIEIPLIECEALVALYNSTNGSSWGNHSNWLVTYTPGNWFGVTVTSGTITSIQLVSNQLTGIIPAQMGNLISMQQLNLMDNLLTGSIPSELGNLSSLVELKLLGNQLSGNIPPQLGNLVSLTYLDLSYNQLSGSIPSELGNLTSLEQLTLSRN